MEYPDVAQRVVNLAAEWQLVGQPVLVADRSNMVLRLDPHLLVARVAMASAAARTDPTWVRREVEVARFLGPELSTQPSTLLPAGPHERDGCIVSFWALEDVRSDTADPTVMGARLADCHRRLRDYPIDTLPFWGGWEEVKQLAPRVLENGLLSASEVSSLRRGIDACERIVELAPHQSAAVQALHGDAHLGNVLHTTRGVLWTDWEDAFVGPVEFDLACLESKARVLGEAVSEISTAMNAYADRMPFQYAPNWELVKELGRVRNTQVIVWLGLFAERQPELLSRLRLRLRRCDRREQSLVSLTKTVRVVSKQ